eukprot:TRINITY_DN1084_c0_g2_i1.p1 TRINITY_DN1084_c0_g2~~TRINITY_DN1084_c0_g2_i1.p1  ORF type:complete len:519 (+),score=78.34 TRINITY_DN1084_c0_g2_i1:91-1557(+)
MEGAVGLASVAAPVIAVVNCLRQRITGRNKGDEQHRRNKGDEQHRRNKTGDEDKHCSTGGDKKSRPRPPAWQRSVMGSEWDHRTLLKQEEMYFRCREQRQELAARLEALVREDREVIVRDAYAGLVNALGSSVFGAVFLLSTELLRRHYVGIVSIRDADLQRRERTGARQIQGEAEAGFTKIVAVRDAIQVVAACGDPTGLLDCPERRMVKAPRHWFCKAPQEMCYSLPASSDTFRALSASLTTRSEWLGHGKDFKTTLLLRHAKLVLKHAWRIENHELWHQFAVARDRVVKAVSSGRLPRHRIALRQENSDSLGPQGTRLPEPLHDNEGVNEFRLFHGTNVKSLQGIMHHGFNERLCIRAAFGLGVYMAEDVGKADQYCTAELPDSGVSRILYNNDTPPSGLCYVFVCRAVCGCPVLTKDGVQRDSDGGGDVFTDQWRRELVTIDGSSERYTSLLAELGGIIARYREFVFFRGQLLYPEYLIAYARE